MHLALFHQYYNSPDCETTARHHAFLNHWSKHHRISLITTRQWYDRRLSRKFAWVPPGVDLYMFDVPYDNAMGSRQRLGAFARYAGRAIWTGLRLDRPDVIIGTSTPLTAAWAAATVAAIRRIPWVFQVRDLWPDFPVQMGAVRHPLVCHLLYALEHRLYHSAAHIVTLSPDMTAHVKGHRLDPNRVSTIVNGTDFDLIDAVQPSDVQALREAYGFGEKCIALYGGTYGRANDMPTLIATAERLTHRQDLHFVFAGSGFDAPLIREAAARLPNVSRIPPQPRHQMFAWFKLADVSLVPFIDKPVLAANSPAKLFDSLGASTPVIVTSAGWTKHFVETHGCGWYVPATDPSALAKRLIALCAQREELTAAGKRGREAAWHQFDRTRLALQFEEILINAAAGQATVAAEAPCGRY